MSLYPSWAILRETVQRPWPAACLPSRCLGVMFEAQRTRAYVAAASPFCSQQGSWSDPTPLIARNWAKSPADLRHLAQVLPCNPHDRRTRRGGALAVAWRTATFRRMRSLWPIGLMGLLNRLPVLAHELLLGRRDQLEDCQEITDGPERSLARQDCARSRPLRGCIQLPGCIWPAAAASAGEGDFGQNHRIGWRQSDGFALTARRARSARAGRAGLSKP